MALVTVRIPGLLTRFTDGQRECALEADTVNGSVDALVLEHPALEPHLLHPCGGLRPHLQLYLNNRTVRWNDEQAMAVSDGDLVEVFQAVSGG